ncbi:hypothetical protein HPP92_018687 [Vanilla planifolia]|uniref:Red chlorophyll catabolite reductase n=1 Tax=Vanilla planifolia TaxID=51239 RepID=A0A835UN46_VANPL|nr:hypothetical protein HPP92_018687 [Vanilla planifolia]
MLSSMLSFSSHSSVLSCAFLRRSPSQGSYARQGSTLVSMKRRDKDFPLLPPAHRALTLDLFSAIDDRLDSVLLPSTVPSDVLRFENPQGTAHGSVEIRSGSPTSLLDLVLQSWLHCKLPGGSGEINITTLFGFLDSTSHAPHLLVELIQGGPSSLVLVIDLLPRKDVVLHPDYLDEFYLETNLDGPRQDLERLPQVSPYRSPSLFIRSVLSPTAVAVTINGGKEVDALAFEEVMARHVGEAAKKVISIWIEKCLGAGQRVPEEEREGLERRDGMIKRKAVEIDLVANLPKMFGPEVADRVVAQVQKAFRVV